jgi:DNA adenine methylase
MAADCERRENEPMSTPIVKWAGGKGKLVERIISRAPTHFHTYHEPFVGGGAVFFGLCREGRIRRAVLNDLNTDLIDTYRAVRDELDSVTEELGRLADEYLAAAHEDRAAVYYRVRAAKPANATARAAWLMFLNRTCYNGLYRVNRRSEFNVPHGDYVNPRILDKEGLSAASTCLQRAELTSVDFPVACRRAEAGDFVYLDPPYQPLTATANFTSYTSGNFGEADQLRLRDEFEALTLRGVAAILSNSSHQLISDSYEGRGYSLERVFMARAINSAAEGRAPIAELLISNMARPEVIQAFSSRPK